MFWAPRTLLSGRLSALTLLAMVVACGGGIGTPAPSPPAITPTGTGIQPSGSLEPTHIQPTPTAELTDDSFTVLLAWFVRLLPGTPNLPEKVDFYMRLRERTEESCRKVSDQAVSEPVSLYRGAANVCLGALTGTKKFWAKAQEAHDAFGDRPEGCLDQAVFEALGAALADYADHPNAKFDFERNGKDAVQLHCPSILNVNVAHQADGGLEIVITGKRLGREMVQRVTYRVADPCPDLGTQNNDPAEVTEQADDRISALISGDAVPSDARFVLVSLIADPDPWVADARCVEIGDAQPTETPAASGT